MEIRDQLYAQPAITALGKQALLRDELENRWAPESFCIVVA
jgi:hypothetical protein